MILGREIQPGDPLSLEGVRTLTGMVQVSGEWEGVVAFICPKVLASRLTAIMFGVAEEATLSLDQVLDAVGELTNMLGGNVKALVPAPTTLSLPTVVEGLDYTLQVHARKRVQTRVCMSCEGTSFVVAILSPGEPESS